MCVIVKCFNSSGTFFDGKLMGRPPVAIFVHLSRGDHTSRESAECLSLRQPFYSLMHRLEV